MFQDYGWECQGVDLPSNENFVKDAVHGNWGQKSKFYAADLNADIPFEVLEQSYDAILFSNVTYYLDPKARLDLLKKMYACLKPGGFIFLIERLNSDYRFGKGLRLAPNRFTLNISETNEFGLTILFFSRDEIISTLFDISHGEIEDIVVLESRYDNLLNNRVVRNSELTVWGKKNSERN